MHGRVRQYTRMYMYAVCRSTVVYYCIFVSPIDLVRCVSSRESKWLRTRESGRTPIFEPKRKALFVKNGERKWFYGKNIIQVASIECTVHWVCCMLRSGALFVWYSWPPALAMTGKVHV